MKKLTKRAFLLLMIVSAILANVPIFPTTIVRAQEAADAPVVDAPVDVPAVASDPAPTVDPVDSPAPEDVPAVTDAPAEAADIETAPEDAPATDMPAAAGEQTVSDQPAAAGPDVNLNVTNNATTSNEVITEADTGDNTISISANIGTTTASSTATTTDTGIGEMATSTATSTGITASSTSDAIIKTGNAIADSNIVNVVNVNIFDSEALIAFLTKLSNGDADNVDLRNLSFAHDGPLGCSECTVSTSSLTSSVTSTTTDNAVITNGVIVRSSTGNNSAESAGTGDSAILTGDAYANASVVNFANTTLIDSKYTMLFLSNFGDWNGDVVLPNGSFFEKMLSTMPSSWNPGGTFDLDNKAAASLNSAVSTNAVTGDNSATSTDGSALVLTGDARSGSSVLNQVNETHIGGGAVAIVFRIYGGWSGDAFNVPPGFSMVKTDEGFELRSIPISEDVLEGLAGQGGSLEINGNAAAQIINNIDVSAKTGGNSASSDGSGAAVVSTGDAYANASVINLVNTASVGRNWMGAIINIFGDWNGNVSFGQPDLWVGTSAEFDNPNNRGPGASVWFRYTITNRGDAKASNVRLRHDFVGSAMSYLDNWNGGRNGIEDVGTLAPGETREISRRLRIGDDIPYGESAISNTITVTAHETDGNIDDNTDVISIIGLRNPPGRFRVTGNADGNLTGYGASGAAPLLVITKTNSATTTVSASSTVSYTILIENKGGPANDAILVDEILNEEGKSFNREEWDLGTVFDGEEITIKYDVAFSSSTAPGRYVNTAKMISRTKAFATSSLATSTVTVSAFVTDAGALGDLVKKKAPELASLALFYSDKPYGPYVPIPSSFFSSLASSTSSTAASISDGSGSLGLFGGLFGIFGSRGDLAAAVRNAELGKIAGDAQLQFALLLGAVWIGYARIRQRNDIRR